MVEMGAKRQSLDYVHSLGERKALYLNIINLSDSKNFFKDGHTDRP